MFEQEARNYQFSVGVGVICDTPVDVSEFRNLILNLAKSPMNPKIAILCYEDNILGQEKVDEDDILREFDIDIIRISKDRMNSGWSREIVRHYLETDIFVSVGVDVYLDDKDMLEKLARPIIKGNVSVSYARQMPTKDANEISTFSKLFNYPEDGNIRVIEDATRYGVYTIFCSNKCAAWKNDVLDKIGGFPWVLYGEDTIATAKLLKSGYKIAYASDAVVKYSQNYSPKQEFKRHFDTGMYRRRWKSILDVSAKDERRGAKYAKEMFRFLWKRNKELIPLAFWQLLMGWFGYKLGWHGFYMLPICIKRRVSPTSYFWSSKEFKDGLWKEPINYDKLLYNTEKYSLHSSK